MVPPRWVTIDSTSVPIDHPIRQAPKRALLARGAAPTHQADGVRLLILPMQVRSRDRATVTIGQPPAAADDRRQRILDAALKRTGFRQDAVIEVLHAAQNAFGYLTPELLWYVAAKLRLPPSRVYGVATFYNFFSLKPPGEHAVIVCEGTVCYIRGAARIGDALHAAFGAAPGETSPDGRVSVTIARCFGSCALAPVIVIDSQVIGKTSPEAAVARVRGVLG
jgi:bidirectional [NiFe] hydrogenase diaphorase subunit